MLLNMKKLPPADSGCNIAHPVIIADLGMLIIPCRIPSLGCQEGCLLCNLLIL